LIQHVLSGIDEQANGQDLLWPGAASAQWLPPAGLDKRLAVEPLGTPAMRSAGTSP